MNLTRGHTEDTGLLACQGQQLVIEVDRSDRHRIILPLSRKYTAAPLKLGILEAPRILCKCVLASTHRP